MTLVLPPRRSDRTIEPNNKRAVGHYASGAALVTYETVEGVSFEVRVAPRASRSELRGVNEGVLKVSLTAPPVEGAANAALCDLLAEVLDVPRRAVEIRQGERNKRKVVHVVGLTAPALLARLASALGLK